MRALRGAFSRTGSNALLHKAVKFRKRESSVPGLEPSVRCRIILYEFDTDIVEISLSRAVVVARFLQQRLLPACCDEQYRRRRFMPAALRFAALFVISRPFNLSAIAP